MKSFVRVGVEVSVTGPLKPNDSADHGIAGISGLAALQSYNGILEFLGKSGSSQPEPVDLPFLQHVPGLKNLFLTMSAVAPAIPDTSEEEWNPISQRPHAVLPPLITDELGAEITALKTAIDEFTILSHEMMHVALWEPFFTGQWRPRTRSSFREFSLMAEGFCYFFSDIVVSGAVRVRLPDGEFALERQTPSNARFHPVRAFQALGIVDHREIVDVYLEGFRGQSTRLWQPRGTSDFAASLAAQAYNFYAGSQRLLDEMHGALTAFGGLTEFYRRFCAVPGLPSFLGESEAQKASAAPDQKSYFLAFFNETLPYLAGLPKAEIERVRLRRMLQMRAYYALQVRWLVRKNLVAAKDMSTRLCETIADAVEVYLSGLQDLLQKLALQEDATVMASLAQLDAVYSRQVRKKFLIHDAWSGQRWLIAPRRAGGCIRVHAPLPPREQEAKRELSHIASFLVEELTAKLAESKSVPARSLILAQIQRLAELGAVGGNRSAQRTRQALRQLRVELARPHLLKLWSVPLASFDPENNRYRELVFSYQ